MSSFTPATALGIGVAATGIAHFVVPDTFAPITSVAFPKDVTTWTYRNGATEFAVGTAIAIPKTRKLGFLALAAYVGFIGYRAFQAR